MNETSQDMAAEIEASLNIIPFGNPDIGAQVAARGLTGTFQLTITGLGSWLCTFKDGMHTIVRCEGPCDPPPDATAITSPETYLRVLKREGAMNAVAAKERGLITVTGDEALAIAVLMAAS
jgi:SCP-2 sterol transfer family